MSTQEKIVASFIVVVIAAVLSLVLRAVVRLVFRSARVEGARFWSQQLVKLIIALASIGFLAAIWFAGSKGSSGVSAAASGSSGGIALITAGVAVALQRVITAFAAYLLILRGRLFVVGDRITIGGVRGDVVSLGFVQTRVMEMGQTHGEHNDPPSVWVGARQYTGRIVTVSNDKIFDTPVYNYTRQFPFLWEEMKIPIKYTGDRARAEEIILAAAERHTRLIREKAAPARNKLVQAYHLKTEVDLEPSVYWTLTDNWLEIAVRFIVEEAGIRRVKDAISRDILAGLEAAHIGIASSTYEITYLAPVRIENAAEGK